jgi:hypothetical protein
MSISYFEVFSTCRKTLGNGADGFTSPPKERVLLIFNALKNQLPSAGFEPANVGFNGKHANHLSTEADKEQVTIIFIKAEMIRKIQSLSKKAFVSWETGIHKEGLAATLLIHDMPQGAAHAHKTTELSYAQYRNICNVFI